MASTDRPNDRDSFPEKGRVSSEALDERRRAALAEIDQAPFSSVLSVSLDASPHPFPSVGSTSKSVLSPALVSSPMRMSYSIFPVPFLIVG